MRVVLNQASVQKYKIIPTLLFVILMQITSLANAGMILPMRALCYDSKDSCIRARSQLEARDADPVDINLFACARETNELNERTRVNCKKNQWKLNSQLRSTWSEETLIQKYSKLGYLPLRSTCTDTCYDAQRIVSLITEGSEFSEWLSVNNRYALELSCRRRSNQEVEKSRNRECENKDYLVEYKIKLRHYSR